MYQSTLEAVQSLATEVAMTYAAALSSCRFDQATSVDAQDAFDRSIEQYTS